MNKFISLGLSILILNGCYEMSVNNPPKPKKIPYKLEAHGDIRIDDYYWMRDDTRSDPELISYLESENDYFQKWQDSNVDYQPEIYNELKNMIPVEEETLRVKEGNFYYYSRIKASEQYSTYYRNNSSEEIIFLSIAIFFSNSAFLFSNSLISFLSFKLTITEFESQKKIQIKKTVVMIKYIFPNNL